MSAEESRGREMERSVIRTILAVRKSREFLQQNGRITKALAGKAYSLGLPFTEEATYLCKRPRLNALTLVINRMVLLSVFVARAVLRTPNSAIRFISSSSALVLAVAVIRALKVDQAQILSPAPISDTFPSDVAG